MVRPLSPIAEIPLCHTKYPESSIPVEDGIFDQHQEREAFSQYHDTSGKAIRFLFKIEMNSLDRSRIVALYFITVMIWHNIN
jgi:hypothetical protein